VVKFHAIPTSPAGESCRLLNIVIFETILQIECMIYLHRHTPLVIVPFMWNEGWNENITNVVCDDDDL
jgi:hypothetical protein